MKRIYLLMIVMLAVVGNTFAQNSDLELTQLFRKATTGSYAELKGNDTILIDGLTRIYIGWRIKNNGPDSIKTTDSIFVSALSSGRRYVARLGAFTPPNNKALRMDSTISIFPVDPVIISPGSGITASGVQKQDWCDSLYAKDPTNTPIPDAVLGNNRKCTNTNLEFHLLSVDGTITKGSEEFLLYPNPATNNMNIKFDFGTPTQADVRVIDVTGKVVYTQDLGVQSGVQDVALKLTNVTTGLYMVQLTTSAGTFTQRLTLL